MKILIVLLTLFGVSTIATHDTRITNGNLAQIGQFPYQAGLNISYGNATGWCGGTLISDRWVVTAAHCMEGADTVIVYLGTTKITEEEPGQHRIYVNKSNIITHGEWAATEAANDISLLKLPIRIEFNERVQAATLPRLLNGSYSNYEDVVAYASGWGLESDSANSVSPTLRYVQMPIMNHNYCKIYWSGAVSEKMICMSTTSGKSTCYGDSGGPLVYKDGDTNYLIGATSFGLTLGCELGFPAVFTRITSYLEWIEQHIGLLKPYS